MNLNKELIEKIQQSNKGTDKGENRAEILEQVRLATIEANKTYAEALKKEKVPNFVDGKFGITQNLLESRTEIPRPQANQILRDACVKGPLLRIQLPVEDPETKVKKQLYTYFNIDEASKELAELLKQGLSEQASSSSTDKEMKARLGIA